MSKVFSIVIPYYKKRYEIEFLLTALSLQTFNKNDFEVIIVDDGSGDQITDILNLYKDEICIHYRYLNHTGNRANVRNIGIEMSNGERLIFLDSDMIPDRKMLTEFYMATNSDSKLVALGTRVDLLGVDKALISSKVMRDNFEIIENLPGFKDERTLNILLKSEHGKEYGDNWQLFYSHCVCVWKSALNSVGGFDESFGVNWGAEDIELGYRLYGAGCKISLLSSVTCYHIFHEFSVNKRIESLKKNYSLFLKKHRHWKVEIFIHEFEIWAAEAIEIQEQIQKRDFIVKSLKNASQLLSNLPDKTLLVGVEDTNLLDSSKIETAFVPQSHIISDKVMNVMGFETLYPDNYFEVTLMSNKYEKINKGLFLSLHEEISRISKKVYYVDENTDIEINKKRSTTSFNRKYLLLSLNNQKNIDREKNNWLNLAIAAHRCGWQVGIQNAYDPLNLIPINDAYQWFSDPNKVQVINALSSHRLNHYGNRILHIMNVEDIPYISRSIDTKAAWIDIQAINSEYYFHQMINGVSKLLFKNMYDYENYPFNINKYFLPVGIDKQKIVKLKNNLVEKGRTFVFMFTDSIFDHYSNLDILVESFDEVFHQNDHYVLKIFCSGFFNSSPNIPRFFSDSFAYIYNTFENGCISEQKKYYFSLKEKYKSYSNIQFIERNMSEEEYSSELAGSDCLIHLNSRSCLFPMVLEAVAMGKKPIIPLDNRYEGYFENDHCFKIKTEKVPTLHNEKVFWPLINDWQPFYNYCLSHRILKDDLLKTLLKIKDNAECCELEGSWSKEFTEKFDWYQVVDMLEKIVS